MKNAMLALGLFAVQIYLTFRGTHHFGKDVNPFLMLAAYMAVPIFFLREKLKQPMQTADNQIFIKNWKAVLWAIGSLFFVALCYEELRKAFLEYDAFKVSDVLPQLAAQFERFLRGEQPYAPVRFETYDAFPIYMPFHFWPLGLKTPFGADLRWSGYVILGIAVALCWYFLLREKAENRAKWVAAILPSLVLWGYILWGGNDLPVSYEMVIGAYYLVLAAGLLSRNAILITLGLVFCVLSRYTLIFWLPVFALLSIQHFGWKKSVFMAGTVALAVVFFYVLPFYSKDPTIFAQGLKYHNDGCAADWRGFGDPPICYTTERGIYFGGYFRTYFPGDLPEKVFWARVVQASMMLSLMFFAFWAWPRWRNRLDFGVFGLVMLYLSLALFYFFGPLTYRYYLISPLMLSAVICGCLALLPKAKS